MPPSPALRHPLKRVRGGVFYRARATIKYLLFVLGVCWLVDAFSPTATTLHLHTALTQIFSTSVLLYELYRTRGGPLFDEQCDFRTILCNNLVQFVFVCCQWTVDPLVYRVIRLCLSPLTAVVHVANLMMYRRVTRFVWLDDTVDHATALEYGAEAEAALP